MISTQWIERRKSCWKHLDDLLQHSCKDGLLALSRADLKELGLLYRQVAADLAVLRDDPSAVHYARYINDLLARAHNIIYSGQKSKPAAILTFFRSTFPEVVRRNLAYCLAALLIFFGSAVIASVVTFQDPDFQLKVLGPAMVETIQRREMWTHSIVTVKLTASSSIMTNNMSVAFTTFAAGITGGIGTLYLMATNGLLFGVIATACWLAGMSGKLWQFVAPHGVLELPAIFIAGGAGLRLAKGLLFPGLHSRAHALSEAGVEGAKMIAGVVPILIIAGIIEGFVSPTALPAGIKAMIAASLFVLLLAYLFATGPVPQERRSLAE